MATAEYKVLVDWDNNSAFEEIAFIAPGQVVDGDSMEDVGRLVRSSPGIHLVRGRDQIRSLAPPMAGAASMELDNQDRIFSPENTDSVLYGDLVPGRKLQARAHFSGTDYYLWTGFLDDIPQYPEPARRAVGLPCLGPLSRLVGQRVSTALYSSIRTDEAIGYILDAIGWPAGDRVLDTGKSTLLWWWLDNEDALSAAKAILNTEGPGAALYEDGQGRIVFESRHYRITTARSTTAQATFSDSGSEPKFLARGFSYNPGLKDVINAVDLTVKTRAAVALAAVWSLGQTVTLAANETRQYVATATDPMTAAVTPVNATDYTVSVGSLSSVTLNRTSGASVTVTLTAGSSGATVTGLQLRAQLVSVSSTTQVANSVDTTASQAKFGRRAFTLDVRAEMQVNVAQDLANAIVGQYQNPRPRTSITVSNGADARLTQNLSREISDRITIVEAQTGLNTDFWVERIEHNITSAGLHHHTTFGCEKVTGTNYAVWGTAIWGTSVWGY